MHSKKIMFVTLSIYGGGAERVVALLSNGLAERGYEVYLILFRRKDKEYSISDKINLHVLKATGKIGKIRELREAIKSSGVKIVIPFLALPTEYTYIASLGLDLTFIATVRNNPQLYPSQRGKRVVVNWITRHADKIMLQTQEQSQYFSEKVRGKCFVVSNPVKEEMLNIHYEYRDEIHRICTFGRLNKQKNHKLLIEAFSEVCKDNDKIELYIYGDGEEKDKLVRLSIDLGLEDRVHFPGNTQEVGKELSNNDLFVLSSDYEGFPNALMEAMAVGLPCISTDCETGPNDIIEDGENGFLVPCGDVEGLSSAMELLINDFETRKKFSENGRAKIKANYTTDHIIDLLEKSKVFMPSEKAW